MSVPATVNFLEKASTNAIVAQMNEVAAWCATAGDESELISAAGKAKLVSTIVKQRQMAAEVALAALRLEAAALRRLAALGVAKAEGLLPTQVAALSILSKMTDDDFDDFVSGITKVGALTPLLHGWRAAKNRKDAADDIADGTRSPAHYPYFPSVDDAMHVADAAQALLDQLSLGGNFTVSEAASRLADRLHIEDVGPLERHALRDVVREALRLALPINDDDLPKFVTYRDEELGWFHVPTGRATLGQFRWMVAYRQEQADHMAAAAKKLSHLLEFLDKRADATGADFRTHDAMSLGALYGALADDTSHQAA